MEIPTADEDFYSFSTKTTLNRKPPRTQNGQQSSKQSHETDHEEEGEESKPTRGQPGYTTVTSSRCPR
jgi:hypothetical protein